jgi:hypothetical protein
MTGYLSQMLALSGPFEHYDALLQYKKLDQP